MLLLNINLRVLYFLHIRNFCKDNIIQLILSIKE